MSNWPSARVQEKIEEKKVDVVKSSSSSSSNPKPKRTYKKRASTSTKTVIKSNKKFPDEHVPFSDKGHSLEQLRSWSEEKQKAVLGEKYSEYKKKYE